MKNLNNYILCYKNNNDDNNDSVFYDGLYFGFGMSLGMYFFNFLKYKL